MKKVNTIFLLRSPTPLQLYMQLRGVLGMKALFKLLLIKYTKHLYSLQKFILKKFTVSRVDTKFRTKNSFRISRNKNGNC